jgi:hypothetical protein
MSLTAVAGPSLDIAARAGRMEKRTKNDLTKGAITQDEADKIDQQLDHVRSEMVSQASTTSLRRGVRTELDRLADYLTSKEQGKPADDSVLTSSSSDSDSDAAPSP